MAAKNQTQVDRWLKRLKNNRAVAVVIVTSIVLAGAAQFTKSIGDLLDFMSRYGDHRSKSEPQPNTPAAVGAGGRFTADQAAMPREGLSQPGQPIGETEISPRPLIASRSATERVDDGASRPRVNESKTRDGSSDAAKALSGPSPCAGEDGSAAVRAYALALVDPEGLGAFVRQKAELFAVDGAAIRCFQVLASKLRQGTQDNSSALSDLTKLFEVAPEELGRSNYEARPQPSMSAATWERLSKVLPAMAAGDNAPFHASFPEANTIGDITAADPELKKRLSKYVERIIPSLQDLVRDIATSTTIPAEAR